MRGRPGRAYATTRRGSGLWALGGLWVWVVDSGEGVVLGPAGVDGDGLTPTVALRPQIGRAHV